jgi:hypothetical protein
VTWSTLALAGKRRRTQIWQPPCRVWRIKKFDQGRAHAARLAPNAHRRSSSVYIDQHSPFRSLLMAHQDTNVFDSSTVARVWMNKGRAGGLAPSAIAAIDSRKPDSEGLVFHNVTYLASPTADRDSIASFTTSCLLRADATHILRARDPLPLVRTPEAGAFEIRTVHTSRDGDRGMYATRIIPSGSIIVSESPTVLLPPYLWLGSVVQTQAELLSTLFDRLPRAPGGAPDSQLSALLALKNAKAKAGSVEEGIARTNGIAVDILGMAAAGVDGTYTGIFLNIARCNHRFVGIQV